ncbi:MAG TPA: crosslink repair DNA glycosylase YcaQ family protein [Acidimicrobiia bacterium]
MRRYLGGFGPATAAEVANWAGLPTREVAETLERMTLRRFRAEHGDELVDLPRAPLPDSATPAPVRFLPTWDATLLVHARRKGILAEEHRPAIFASKNPHSVGTFLVDGTVAGTWRYDGGKVRTEPFAPFNRTTQREVQDEADRLAVVHR